MIDLDHIMTYIIEGYEDYEIDRKLGDVGSRIRESSIKCLTKLVIELYEHKLFDYFLVTYIIYIFYYRNTLFFISTSH